LQTLPGKGFASLPSLNFPQDAGARAPARGSLAGGSGRAVAEDGGVTRVLPRPIDEAPLDAEDGEQAGYLMPEPEGDPDYAFTDENDRVMLLPAVPAKEGRVQPSPWVLRVKTLTFEGDPPASSLT
jgi:hypothetical protein